LDLVAAAIKPFGPGLGVHFARTRLLALENTYHGQVLPAAYLREATALAHAKGLSTHLDGARVCNAAVAQGITLAQACEGFDSVSLCFSKGLGAPVGSVLVGSRALLERAHRWRKVLGGGMRQAGILAAACLYALDHHLDRLAEDHANAERLARGLAAIPQVAVLSQATNMVFAQFPEAHASALEAHLAQRGILSEVLYESRFVTHLDVTEAGVDAFVGAVRDYFATRGGAA
jgi:threonine aldolase